MKKIISGVVLICLISFSCKEQVTNSPSTDNPPIITSSIQPDSIATMNLNLIPVKLNYRGALYENYFDAYNVNIFALKQGGHADVAIGNHACHAIDAIAGAHGQASAILIPHELRGTVESVLGLAGRDQFGHQLFYTHGDAPGWGCIESISRSAASQSSSSYPGQKLRLSARRYAASAIIALRSWPLTDAGGAAMLKTGETRFFGDWVMT